MKIPPLVKSAQLLERIQLLRNTEDSRNSNDKTLFNDLILKTISKKDYKKALKNKNLEKQTKELDSKIINQLLNYTNLLSEISQNLEINNFKNYKFVKRSIFFKIKRALNELFTASKSTKIASAKIITTTKQVDNKSKIKKDIASNEELPTVNKIPNLQEPKFVLPKEILPENYQVLIPNFAYAFIEEGENQRRYIVAEPELETYEKKILEDAKTELIKRISLSDLKQESEMYKRIEDIFKKNKIKLDTEQKSKIFYYIARQINGLDKIEPLMHDPLIEDIECDGVGIPIFIVHRKYGHIETNLMLESEKESQQFIIKMAHLCKSYVSYASPLLDAILPDGSRVNATLTSNVSTRGPTFTIRKFPQTPLTAIDLINSKTINPLIAAYIWTVIEFKKTIIVVGPTAAGKTTLLNVITSFIPPAERVVSIEDTREINLLLDNWIPQITRPGFGPPDSNGKRYGEVTMTDLLKESFRQRPDYLILGEVRGEEMALMFQGMASGHCCLSTVHSRSVHDLTNRLITPPISLDPSLLTSLDVVIVSGFSGSSEIEREIKEIDEIKDYNSKENKIEFNAVYKAEEYSRDEKKEGDLFTKDLPITYKSDVLKEICTEHNIHKRDMLEMIDNRIKFLSEMTKTPPKDYAEFKIRINKYKQTEKLKF
ncbi:MAG: type II/IV secretion system ATPase subunit [archaeon]